MASAHEYNVKIYSYQSLNLCIAVLTFFTSVIGALNVVDGSKDSLVREEILHDLDDSDDEADKNTFKDDGDADDLDPFFDSD